MQGISAVIHLCVPKQLMSMVFTKCLGWVDIFTYTVTINLTERSLIILISIKSITYKDHAFFLVKFGGLKP